MMRATFNIGNVVEETGLTQAQFGELIERALGRMVNPNNGKPIKLVNLGLTIEVRATEAQSVQEAALP
jgi:hypothetical protein